MGLFVLKDSSDQLLQLSFEEILNEITEKPKAILSPPPTQILVEQIQGASSINEEEESKVPSAQALES